MEFKRTVLPVFRFGTVSEEIGIVIANTQSITRGRITTSRCHDPKSFHQILAEIEEEEVQLVNDLEVTVNCQEALKRLIANRKQHQKVVKEARTGYVKEAKRALAKKLKLLEQGKITDLSFSLRPPQDYTKVYDVAIEMLTLHQGETIELGGAQVRNLMMDEWDWTRQFLYANYAYSATAKKMSENRGYDVE